MTKLSDTQSIILSQASQHEALLAVAPKTLPAAARQAVFRSMLKNGLLEELPAPAEYRGLGWRQDDDGMWLALRITNDGMRAIGVEPEEPSDAGIDPHELSETEVEAELDLQQEALDAEGAAEGALDAVATAGAAQQALLGLRDAALAAVAAWEARSGLDEALEALKAALGGRSTAHAPGGPRKPREGTKQEAVLTLLRRDDGATIAQVM